MKIKKLKGNLIFTIICNGIIGICFLIGLSLLFFKIDLPNKIAKETFVNHMESEGCKVNDMLLQKEYTGMDNYLITDKESCPYLVSYATFTDQKVLNRFFSDGSKDVLRNNPNTTGSTNISINIFSLEYYEYATSGDYYKAIVYNDDSVLYASADSKYRDELINIFKDFNYKFELNYKDMKIAFYSLFILLFIFIVCMWGTLNKTREKGWISLIPIYNIICLSKDILGSVWWSLLLLVPVVNIVLIFLFNYNLGKAFSDNDNYPILNMFFPSVFWPLLVLGDLNYIKPENRKKVVITKPVNRTNNNKSIKKVKTKQNKKSSAHKIIEVIKWIFTDILLLFGVIFIFTYFDGRIMSSVVQGIFGMIYGFMLCPLITDVTKKYKRYTKFKPLIVILLIVINIILMGLIP